jgi:hypothetical protein
MAKISALPLLAAPTGAETVVALDQGETVRVPMDPLVGAAVAPYVAHVEAVAGPTYNTAAAGLAATVDGQSFAVDIGDGTVTIYLNDDGVAVSQRNMATTTALGLPGGAKLIGIDSVAGDLATWLKGMNVVTPEMFGQPGAAANDNDLFLAAGALGKQILALGPLYKLDRPVYPYSVNILVGDATEMRNVQTEGVKEAAITVEGGRVGAPVTVTGFDLINAGGTVDELFIGRLSRKLRVADSSGFAAGDTVEIFEGRPLIASTRKGTPEPEYEDHNYHQLATIESIAGPIITLREYLGWPFKVEYALQVQKVVHVEQAVVKGGKWTGSQTGGGAIAFKYCRDSYAGDIVAAGIGEADADRMGGAPIYFENCWESRRGPVSARWTLFTHLSHRNQSCYFGPVVAGKRTSNGGVIVSSDTLCTFDLILQDAPGSFNGDQIGFGNGARRNTFAGQTGSSSHCYTAWVRESCDDNTFLAFNSFNGITVAVQDFGNRNIWRSIKVRGHPSAGVYFGGDGTQATVDIEGAGTGVHLLGNQRDLRINGRAVCTTHGNPQFKDLLIGANVINSVVELVGGREGAGYAAGAIEHHSNQIIVSGSKPYQLRSRDFAGGGTFRNQLLGVDELTPQVIKVPGYEFDGEGVPIDTPDGLIDLRPQLPATDDGVVFEINLTRNQGYEGAWSTYKVLSRQGEFVIMREVVGAPANPGFEPRLRLRTYEEEPDVWVTDHTRLECFVGTELSSQVIVEIRQV